MSTIKQSAYSPLAARVKCCLRQALRAVTLRLFRVNASYTAAVIERLRQRHVIVCAKHVSLLDGLFVALTSPIPLVFAVDTDFSRRSWFARQGMDALAALGFGRVVAIDARSPFGLRSLRAALDRGEAVMIFPEGHISPDGRPQPLQPGVGWLAERTGAAIIRIRIAGAEHSRLFAKAGRAWWPRITIEY